MINVLKKIEETIKIITRKQELVKNKNLYEYNWNYSKQI